MGADSVRGRAVIAGVGCVWTTGFVRSRGVIFSFSDAKIGSGSSLGSMLQAFLKPCVSEAR